MIAGNWKMHKTCSESVELAKAIRGAVGSHISVDIVIAPTYPALYAVHEAISGSNVALAAQDLHWEDQGAYTGKVSADMLTAVGVQYVIIGHSEQRSYFHESDETVNKKSLKALSANLVPIICVGETLEERESNRTMEVVERQVRAGCAGIDAGKAQTIVIAYEPVWAIGTGKTATPQMAQEVHAAIRKLLASLFGDNVGQSIRILYGGSMKPDNAAELLSQADIDGGLIGGAALKSDSFHDLIAAAAK